MVALLGLLQGKTEDEKDAGGLSDDSDDAKPEEDELHISFKGLAQAGLRNPGGSQVYSGCQVLNSG